MLGTAAWVASVVAANGVLSLLTGQEVVPLAAAGPLAEPLAVAVAAVLIAVRAARTPVTGRLLPLECLLIAYLAAVLVPAAVTALGGGFGSALLLLGRAAISPFTIVGALLAAFLGLMLLLLGRAKVAGAGRPRWPWEGDDEP